MFGTPLTDKEKAHPHKAVMDNRQSLSVLERSFYRHRFEQIREWDELGVLEQAVSGQVPRVRRKYSRTLMDFFLARTPDWFPMGGRSAERAGVFARLWQLGASQHSECLDGWLHGALADDFASTLLEAGANPHAAFQSRGSFSTATTLLMEGIHRLEEWSVSRNRSDAAQQALVKARARFFHFIQVPGADQEQMDHYLGQLTRLSRGAKAPHDAFWSQAMDRLLELGARPSFAQDRALDNLIHALPPRRGLIWLGAEIEREEKELGHALSAEDREALGRKLAWRETMQNARGAHRALQKFLQHRDKWAEETGVHLGEHYWERLLGVPGGVWVGRKLLAAGVSAPWLSHANKPDHASHYASQLLAGPNGRNPHALRRFARLVDPASLDPQWARQQSSNYLATTSVNRRFHFNHQRTPHGVEELELLAQVVPHRLHDPSAAWQSWMTNLPEQWQQFNVADPDRRQMFDFLRNQGLLSKAINAAEGVSLEERFPERMRPLARAWTKDPALVAMVDACPELEKDWKSLCGVSYFEHDNKELLIPHVSAAVARSPEEADHFWECIKDTLIHKQTKEATRRVWWTIAALRQAGWNFPNPDNEGDLVWQTVCCVDQNWNELAQQRLVGQMKEAGVDFSAEHCMGLRRLVSQEKTLTSMTGMACLLPLATALIEHGVDLTGMTEDEEDPDRPLGCVVRVARQHQKMQQSTPQNRPATHSRRL